MERLKTFRTIIWLVAAIFVVEVGMLVVMLRPDSAFLWMTIGIIALLGIYLIRLSLVMVKDLEEFEREKEKQNHKQQ